MEAPVNHPSYQYPRKPNTFTREMTILCDFWIPIVIIIGLSYQSGILAGCLNALLSFVFSDSLNGVLTQTFKAFAGRPRPYYFNGCDHQLHTCTKSFPSGHSSFAMNGLIFLTYYLYFYHKHKRIQSNLIVVLCCSIPVLLALSIGVTRTRDHFHHFEDIIGGLMLGFIVGSSTFFTTYKRFYIREEEEEDEYDIVNNRTVLMEEE
ncbi:Phosphatidic acid phosphatase type 2 domain-containing protein 1B [Entamoeba marina]